MSDRSVTYLTHDRWWDRSDPAALTAVAADDGFWNALAHSGQALVLTSRTHSKLAILTALKSGGIAAVTSCPGAMGIAEKEGFLAVGLRNGIRIYRQIKNGPDGSVVFLPSQFHYTGRTSVHEVAWDKSGKLWFANTRFSALCTIEQEVPFRIRWMPPFVTRISDQDCCHLNGFAMQGGIPAFVTALAASGDDEGWRQSAPNGGILMDQNGDILLQGLSLPHSPTIIGSELVLLESGKGLLRAMCLKTGRVRDICKLPGFTRGFAHIDGIYFVALSDPRASSGAVADEIKRTIGEMVGAAIFAIDARTGDVIGKAAISFVDEISSIGLIPYPSARISEPERRDLEHFWLFENALHPSMA